MQDYRNITPTLQLKDPNIAFALEMIGLFGFLGIGHISIGKTARGFGLMLGYIIGLFFFVLFGILAFLPSTNSVFYLAPLVIVIEIATPIASGLWAKRTAEEINRQIIAAAQNRDVKLQS